MNTGKRTCDVLKEIRKIVSEKENIDLHQTECNFKGNCSGTCPKCEKELTELNKKVDHKKLVAILSTLTMATTLTACSFGPVHEDLGGVAEPMDINEKENETPNSKDKSKNKIETPTKEETDFNGILSGDVEVINECIEDENECEEYIYSENEEDEDIKDVDELDISDEMKLMLKENMKYKNHLRGVINPRVGLRK